MAKTRADRLFDSSLESVIGIIFIGTPHISVPGLDDATTAANFLYPQVINKALVQSLEPGSFFLFDQTQDFKQLLEQRQIKISTLFEARKTKSATTETWFMVRCAALARFQARLADAFLQVVDEVSATLGISRETKFSVDVENKNLCKFEHLADSALNHIAQNIRAWSKSPQSVPINTTVPGRTVLDNLFPTAPTQPVGSPPPP